MSESRECVQSRRWHEGSAIDSAECQDRPRLRRCTWGYAVAIVGRALTAHPGVTREASGDHTGRAL